MRRPPGAPCRALVFLLALGSGAAAAQTVAISHDFIECWPSDDHPVLSARIVPPEELRAAKVYFRAEQHLDFYFVEASILPGGNVEAVLPRAAPGTERVVYYVEAVTLGFGSTRTDERTPPVADADECRRRDPLLALFDGEAPRILVRGVREGAPGVPPGFLAAGLLSGGGGGVGAAAIGAIAAGGAAGGVVVAAGSGGETATTAASAAPPETSTPPATTSIAGALPTTTTSATGSESPTTTIPVTTTAQTTTTVPITTTAPTTTTTTAIPTSSTTSASPQADVAVSISAPSSILLGNLLTFDVQVANQGPSTATGVTLTVSFPSTLTVQSTSGGSCTGVVGSVRCDLGTLAAGASVGIQVRVLALTLGSITTTASVAANEVDPAPGNNAASVTTNVTLLLREDASETVSVVTHLDVPPHDGRDRGETLLDGRLIAIDSSAPVELRARVLEGVLVVEAVLTASGGRGGRWRFDFRGAPASDGSIRVHAGDVLALGPGGVVFRLRGEPGERLRFTFRARETRN
jgi:hypothetical protein